MITTHNLKDKGSIILYTGCMFSGKTMSMLSAIDRYIIAKKKCVIIKHDIDTRYGNQKKIITNNKFQYSSCDIIKTKSLQNIDIKKYDVIAISEAQFFDDITFVDNWANDGKIIICEGLDGDYQRKPFNNIYKLIPLCEKVYKLSAVCIKCKDEAHFTKRINKSNSNILIGGIESYIPVCRKCYNNSN